MNKLKKIIVKFLKVINKFLEPLSTFLNVVFVAMILLICSQVVAFCYTYLQILNGYKVNIKLFKFINIWGIIHADAITNQIIYENIIEIKSRMEFLINIFIALMGILLSLGTFISYLKRIINDRRKSCFRMNEIFNSGVEDIKIMEEYYKGANFVAVFSNSYSWVKNNENIRNILTELSDKNKLKLYTGDDISDVKERLNTTCQSRLVNCIEKSKISNEKERFSYIERNNTKYLLYRQEEEKHVYIITVHENRESRFMLKVISQLVK